CARGDHTHQLASYFLVRPSTALRLLSAPIWAWVQEIQDFSYLTSGLSSGERRHETQESFPAAGPGADHTQTHDSGRIRAATIAHHT
ncbi:unnamed protein product, partial [Ascophyllum nodosum]